MPGLERIECIYIRMYVLQNGNKMWLIQFFRLAFQMSQGIFEDWRNFVKQEKNVIEVGWE